MDGKAAIIRATVELINENDGDVDNITVRQICRRANVGLGLVNYYFGNKERLLEICVEKIINGIVDAFREIREKTEELSAAEKLDYLGNMTLDFLFAHFSVSRISMLSDFRNPKSDDNTHRTYSAYLPLVAACRPDWDEATVKRKTFILIASMQQCFLRHEEILASLGIDLKNPERRRAYHRATIRDILGV